MRVVYEPMTLDEQTVQFVEPVPASTTRGRESSVPAGSGENTGVSSVVSELARLADRECVPRITRDLREAATPSQPEALVVSLLGDDVTLGAILEMSPLKEDDTLRFLARLVTDGFVALSPPSPASSATAPAASGRRRRGGS
jgi:hypothetical protein